MPDPVSVLPVGTPVKIGGDIDALITAVCLRNGGVTYEAAWWHGRDRKEAWLAPCEVSTGGPVKAAQIGFLGQ